LLSRNYTDQQTTPEPSSGLGEPQGRSTDLIFTGLTNTVYSGGYVVFSEEPDESNLVSMNVVPSSGSIGITIDTWRTSADYYKKWIETSSGFLSVDHTVGDLRPDAYYTVRVDGDLLGMFRANQSGQISFTYTGHYSSHIFEVEEKSLAGTAIFYNQGLGTVRRGRFVSILQTLPGGEQVQAVFPPRSVPGTTDVALELVDPVPVLEDHPLPAGYSLVGDLFVRLRFLAEVERLLAPVTVTFSCSEAHLNELQVSERVLRIAVLDQSTQNWQLLQTKVDTKTATVSTRLENLGLVAVLAPQVPPSQETEQEGQQESPSSSGVHAEQGQKGTASEAHAVPSQILQELEARGGRLAGVVVRLRGQVSDLARVRVNCDKIDFRRNLKQGMSGADVKCLQALLNTDSDTQVAASGPGSPGNETTYFGPLTKAAVIKFQEKYASDVLAPWGLSSGTGFGG